jgi:hypothetical protein
MIAAFGLSSNSLPSWTATQITCWTKAAGGGVIEWNLGRRQVWELGPPPTEKLEISFLGLPVRLGSGCRPLGQISVPKWLAGRYPIKVNIDNSVLDAGGLQRARDDQAAILAFTNGSRLLVEVHGNLPVQSVRQVALELDCGVVVDVLGAKRADTTPTEALRVLADLTAAIQVKGYVEAGPTWRHSPLRTCREVIECLELAHRLPRPIHVTLESKAEALDADVRILRDIYKRTGQ